MREGPVGGSLNRQSPRSNPMRGEGEERRPPAYPCQRGASSSVLSGNAERALNADAHADLACPKRAQTKWHEASRGGS
jgi:hypothetical protein